MFQQILGFMGSFFANASFWGVLLALVFGAIWLAAYWPPFFKNPWLWAVMVAGAFLGWAAMGFIQAPIQIGIQQLMVSWWGEAALNSRPLLTAFPIIIFSGLVQEGALLVPVVIYWWRQKRTLDPRLGLLLGAVAGAGFGIFEAQWVHNTVLAMGWNWEVVQQQGISALIGFWERFVVLGLYTAATALAGFGLAKGWGWQFYLFSAVMIIVLNYLVPIAQLGYLTVLQAEIVFTIWSFLATALVLWLRWRKTTPPVVTTEAVLETKSEPDALEKTDS